MKHLKITLLLLFIYTSNGYAQNKLLYNQIQQAKNLGKEFNLVSAFASVNTNTLQNKRIQDQFINAQEVYIFQYNKSVVKDLDAFITLSIPASNKNLQLELQEVFIDFQVQTGSGQTFSPSKDIRHYRGIVKGDPNSLVAITFAENEVMGLIATNEGNFNLGLDRQLGEHIFFNDRNLKQKPEFSCKIEDTKHVSSYYDPDILFRDPASFTDLPKKILKLYFEVTYDIFEAHNKDLNSVTTFISGMYNQVALLFQAEGITTALANPLIWDIPDPYISVAPNTLHYLLSFAGQRRSFFKDGLHVATEPDFNYTNVTVTTNNTTVTKCGNINVQNVTVTNNRTLTLIGVDINIQSLTINQGSKLILEASGEVTFGNGFDLQTGAELEMR
jgi:hypothetical protein